MHRRTRRKAALAALTTLLLPLTLTLAGCAKVGGEEEGEAEKAAKVEKEGDQSKVVLLDEAAKRLGIETTEIAGLDAGRESVPYSAVIYDAEGHAWVFTSTEELSYIKAPVTIDRIDGDRAILTEGPEVGTPVVIQGAEELFGVEDGIGEFE